MRKNAFSFFLVRKRNWLKMASTPQNIFGQVPPGVSHQVDKTPLSRSRKHTFDRDTKGYELKHHQPAAKTPKLKSRETPGKTPLEKEFVKPLITFRRDDPKIPRPGTEPDKKTPRMTPRTTPRSGHPPLGTYNQKSLGKQSPIHRPSLGSLTPAIKAQTSQLNARELLGGGDSAGIISQNPSPSTSSKPKQKKMTSLDLFKSQQPPPSTPGPSQARDPTMLPPPASKSGEIFLTPAQKLNIENRNQQIAKTQSLSTERGDLSPGFSLTPSSQPENIPSTPRPQQESKIPPTTPQVQEKTPQVKEKLEPGEAATPTIRKRAAKGDVDRFARKVPFATDNRKKRDLDMGQRILNEKIAAKEKLKEEGEDTTPNADEEIRKEPQKIIPVQQIGGNTQGLKKRKKIDSEPQDPGEGTNGKVADEGTTALNQPTDTSLPPLDVSVTDERLRPTVDTEPTNPLSARPPGEEAPKDKPPLDPTASSMTEKVIKEKESEKMPIDEGSEEIDDPNAPSSDNAHLRAPSPPTPMDTQKTSAPTIEEAAQDEVPQEKEQQPTNMEGQIKTTAKEIPIPEEEPLPGDHLKEQQPTNMEGQIKTKAPSIPGLMPQADDEDIGGGYGEGGEDMDTGEGEGEEGYDPNVDREPPIAPTTQPELNELIDSTAEEYKVQSMGAINSHLFKDEWMRLSNDTDRSIAKFNEMSLRRNKNGKTMSQYLAELPEGGQTNAALDSLKNNLIAMKKFLKVKNRNVDAMGAIGEKLVHQGAQEMKGLKNSMKGSSLKEINVNIDGIKAHVDEELQKTLESFNAESPEHVRNDVEDYTKAITDLEKHLTEFYSEIASAESDAEMNQIAQHIDEVANQMGEIVEKQYQDQYPRDPFSGDEKYRSRKFKAGESSITPAPLPTERPPSQLTTTPAAKQGPYIQAPQQPKIIQANPSPQQGTEASSALDGYYGPYEPNSMEYLHYFPLPYNQGNLEFWKATKSRRGLEFKNPVYLLHHSKGKKGFSRIRKRDLPHVDDPKTHKAEANAFIKSWIDQHGESYE